MKRTARLTLLMASLTLWAATLPAYLFRPDWCAALTIWPAWLWPVIGLLAAAGALSRTTWRLTLTITAAWAVFAVCCVEETWSLTRLCCHQQPAGLRVVSLNCAGNPSAAEEVAPERPDIVLLQESPTRRQVEDLARQLYASAAVVVWGPDASLLARGTIVTSSVPHLGQVHVALARIQLASFGELEIVSVRLPPSLVRMDLWNAECWREYAADRRQRREWLQVLLRELESIPTGTPLIVGGDFNAPGGDAIFRLFQPRLSDTFRTAGRGGGATLISDLPIVRIDQLWVSDHLQPQTVVVKKTKHSDHRMVIGDLQLRRR